MIIRFTSLILLFLTAPLTAQITTAPISIADAGGTTGSFRVILSARSPLSAPADVGKRLSLKPAQLKSDYDLSKETFTVFVPKQPGDNGKYGLIVGVCQHPYGWYPKAWQDVFEKDHLIWIGDDQNGEDRDGVQRIGVMLDAVNGATKQWPIDDQRIYASVNTFTDPVSVVALYYPDVFSGMLHSIGSSWFKPYKGVGAQSQAMYTDPAPFTRPISPYWGQAIHHSRIVFAYYNDGEAHRAQNEAVFHNGYLAAGFEYVKFFGVDHGQMGEYADMTPDWFEKGIQLLDAGIPKKRVTTNR